MDIVWPRKIKDGEPWLPNEPSKARTWHRYFQIIVHAHWGSLYVHVKIPYVTRPFVIWYTNS